MSKICPECGKSFNGSQGQKYCSYRCCKRHNRKAKEIKHPDPPKGVSIIRAFPCKECGHEVLVWERTDKRTVFCCSLCEKKYWKHNTSKCQKVQNRKETVRKYWERMESEERPILTCPVCGKEFRQKHCERICSDECRAKKAIEAGKKIRAVRQQLKKEREEVLGVEIKLAKKIKKGKVCAGCGVIFRAKGGEEYCKTCREKGVTWGIE